MVVRCPHLSMGLSQFTHQHKNPSAVTDTGLSRASRKHRDASQLQKDLHALIAITHPTLVEEIIKRLMDSITLWLENRLRSPGLRHRACHKICQSFHAANNCNRRFTKGGTMATAADFENSDGDKPIKHGQHLMHLPSANANIVWTLPSGAVPKGDKVCTQGGEHHCCGGKSALHNTC